MKKKICDIFINKKPFSFEVEGDFFWGESEALYKKNNSVLENVSWENEGFSNLTVFSEKEFFDLKSSVRKTVLEGLRKAEVEVEEDLFTLENYHVFVQDETTHFNVINYTRNLTVDDLDFDIELLAKRIGKHLKCNLTTWVEELGKSHVQIRLSRPNSLDINPPHRDGYLSFWENIINVWIPVAGCNEKSSLPVVSGSHKIAESEILRTEAKGAKINGNLYQVPCLLESKQGPFYMERPNPKEGEALLFTPFLIHGAAVNLSNDTTRVALEFRFPKI